MDPPDLVAEALATTRVVLTPLTVGDAADMAQVLSDPALYRWTGGAPPTLPELERRYRRQTQGPPPAGERWLNWVLRLSDGQAVGYVQATLTARDAALAWVVGSDYQGRGYASEAAAEVVGWLAARGVVAVTAHIAPGHRASERVAAALGLHPTGQSDADGEAVWRLDLRSRQL